MRNLILLCLVSVLALPAWGAVGLSATGKASLSKKETKKMERFEKNQARQEARMDRLQAKMEKKLEKKGIAKTDSILDNAKFRLGLYILAGAIVLSILAAIISGSGFLGVIAGIAGLAALVLLIWGLIEYTE